MHSLRALRLLRTRQLLPNNLARATATSTSPKQGVPQNGPDNVPPPTTVEEEERDRVPTPFAPSPKLESHEVGPADTRAPSLQQKRRLSTAAAAAAARALEAASCVGVDGAAPLSAAGAEAAPAAPPPAKEEEGEEGDDNEAYYRDHKPSPLSQVEMVDTRKPINRGVVVVVGVEGGEGRGVMVEETVDDALARAEAMFREAAARGDPDLPHSRALARLLRQRKERFRGGSYYI
ncbi:hypothetical protein ACMD2_20359 [Ananas comosus]|uniref:Uncharacterized protein n=2 Tax=Ananas comosus TaxID=4615 RepID=A0A199VEA8_ANACO|nr:hypothetical protein ACMD2_20359 [Ananas comosus]CAD1833276.1 unnamed protein product [Ananas comosus var. bracteatus]